MRIINFPSRSEPTSAEDGWASELEAALDGRRQGPHAETWRQLREQVRSSAPPMTPEFDRKLRAQLAELQRPAVPKRGHPLAWLLRPSHLGLVATLVLGTIVALVIITGQRPSRPAPQTVTAPRSASAIAAPAATNAQRHSTNQPLQASAAGQAGQSAPTVAVGAAPRRIQQLAASITLAPQPGEVQETADRVSRLTVSYGGFVQSSHVNVTPSSGEANLTLSLPSTKLSAALAALADLAPVRAESQSLQDITSAYDTARQRLAEVRAEQRALLRALSRASTQGQIESLRERLAQARGAIAQARSTLQTISHQAANAEVEVNVMTNPHTTGEGLTLKRGLHDASRVLTVVLVVLLISAAALVPLALLVLMLVSAHSAWRRYQRERALQNN